MRDEDDENDTECEDDKSESDDTMDNDDITSVHTHDDDSESDDSESDGSESDGSESDESESEKNESDHHDASKEYEQKYDNDDDDEIILQNALGNDGHANDYRRVTPYKLRSQQDQDRQESRCSSNNDSSDDTAAGKLNARNDSDTASESEKSDEWEVDRISKFRRVGRKRNGYQYLTHWTGDWDPTWEPPSSFQLDDPSGGTKFLDVYNDFRTLVDTGAVTEGVSVDAGENTNLNLPSLELLSPQPASSNSGEHGASSTDASKVDYTALLSIAKRIDLLALIVKSGVEVTTDSQASSIRTFLAAVF
jgi:hypothetical protein